MTKIKYNQDFLNQLSSNLNRLSTKFETSSNSKLENNETLFSGIKKVNKNMETIGIRAKQTSLIIAKQSDAFIEGEKYVEKVFDAIDIPEDLDNVYYPTEEVKNNVTLTKEDGKEISNKTEEKELDYEDNYSVKEYKIFKNKTKNNELQEYEDNYEGKQVELLNIDKAVVKEQEYEDIYDQNKIKLKDVNLTNTEQQEYYDYHIENPVELKNIDNEETKEQHFYDNYYVKSVDVNNIKNEKDISKEQYDRYIDKLLEIYNSEEQ